MKSFIAAENRKYFVSFVILFTLMFKGMQSGREWVPGAMFWVIPAAVLFEAALQKIREFHILFGVLTIAYMIFSVYRGGLSAPLIVMILCVLIGCPMLTAASACGTGLWMLVELTHKPAFMDFFSKRFFGWIFLAIGLVAFNRYVDMFSDEYEAPDMGVVNDNELDG